MVDIVARANVLGSPDIAAYRDASELDIVARAAHDYYPDLNAYPGWNKIPPAAASTSTIITIVLGQTTETATAYSLYKIKKTQFDTTSSGAFAFSLPKIKNPFLGRTEEIASAYSLVFTIDTGTTPTIQYHRYLFSPLLRKPNNRYPLGTTK